MSKFYPCTAADPMGSGGEEGLLGQGDLPWPEVVAARYYGRLDMGGIYAADDVSAAEFLIHELKSPETQMTAEEAEESSLLLHSLIAKMQSSGNTAVEQIRIIQKKAESIPIVGPLLFSPASLPGNIAGSAAIGHAASKSTRVEDLFDVTDATKKKLKKWAASRGKPGSVSAAKAMKGRLKLVRVGGNLYFEVPANSRAAMYRVAKNAVGSHIYIPAYDTAKALRSTARVDSNAYGSRGVGQVLTSKAGGGLLAFGPQAAIDVISSSSVGEFMEKSAYSQPGNGLAFAAGLVIGGASAPAVVVAAASLGAGLVIQFVLSDDVTGWGRDIGDFLTGKD